MNDKEKITYLSWDAAFDILTRPALDIAISEQSGSWHVYVLDLNDIHKLNNEFGYERVNNTIANALAYVRHYHKNVIMGRVFSGDEIAIACKTNQRGRVLNTMKQGFRQRGIGFKYTSSSIAVGHPAIVSGQINAMSMVLNKDPNYAEV